MRPIKLSVHQSESENKKRRNNVYENIGLVFKYSDPDKKSGESLPMKVADLQIRDTWKENIKEIDFHTYIRDFYLERESLIERESTAQRRFKNVKEEYDKALAQPLNWAMRTLWARYVDYGVLLFIGLLGLIAIRMYFSD